MHQQLPGQHAVHNPCASMLDRPEHLALLNNHPALTYDMTEPLAAICAQ
jgi:hypothetical protein